METDSSVFLCHQCGKTFNKLSTLESHTKWKHSEKTSEFVCELCGRTFQKKYNLQKHMQTGLHFMQETVNCAVDDCGFKSINRKMMGSHYQRFHGISLKETTEYFNTFEEFCLWKSEFENKTNARFVKLSSSRIKKDGCTKSTYFCHRDGNFTPKGKNARHVRLKGSNKINAHCPAKIDVEAGEKLVVVSYINTHLGHDLDASRISLDLADKEWIAQKLSMKVPFEDILHEINSTPNLSKRMSLVTRKDLWNIVDNFKLNPENIVSSKNVVNKTKTINELGRNNKLNSTLQLEAHSINSDGQIIYRLNNSEENQIFNENLIIVDGEDGEEIHHYALVSEDDNIDEKSCFIINAQGELESIGGQQIVGKNEEDDEDSVTASNDYTSTLSNPQCETSECEMSVVDEESGEVLENISWDDIVIINGEAYKIEKPDEDEEEAVLLDEMQNVIDLPLEEHIVEERDTEATISDVINKSDSVLNEDLVVKTEFDDIGNESSEHFDNSSSQAMEEDGNSYEVIVGDFENSEEGSLTVV